MPNLYCFAVLCRVELSQFLLSTLDTNCTHGSNMYKTSLFILKTKLQRLNHVSEPKADTIWSSLVLKLFVHIISVDLCF